jgi:hypothetical protein
LNYSLSSLRRLPSTGPALVTASMSNSQFLAVHIQQSQQSVGCRFVSLLGAELQSSKDLDGIGKSSFFGFG